MRGNIFMYIYDNKDIRKITKIHNEASKLKIL